MGAKSGGDAASNWQDLPQQFWQSMLDAARPLLPESAALSDPIQRLMAMIGGAGDGFAGQAGQRLLAGGEQFVQWAQQLAAALASGKPGATQPAGSEQWSALFQQSLAGFSEHGDPLLKLMQQGIDLVARPLAAGLGAGDPGAQLRSQLDTLLHLPNFGFAREHQERRQKLAQAALAWQDAIGPYQALLGKAGQQGLERLRSKLAEREEPGRQIETLRGLYDLWIDAAEEAYAEIALSSEFRKVYGEMVNRQMALRQAIQAEVEQHCGELGLPTRTELNAVHARLHGMRRQLRELEERLAASNGSDVQARPAVAGQGQTRQSAAPGHRGAPKAATSALPKATEQRGKEPAAAAVLAAPAKRKAQAAIKAPTASKPAKLAKSSKSVNRSKPAKAAKLLKSAKSTKAASSANAASSRRNLNRFA